MLAYRLLVTCCLAAVALACSEPQCPAGYMKYGNQCRRCKPGEVRERGQCVPQLDGAVAAVTEAPDAGEEPPEGAESTPETDDIAGESGDSGEEDSVESEPDPAVDAGSPCYRDEDRDGVGAGAAIDCAQSDGSRVATTNTDCDDTDLNRSPSLSDVCGDKIDNDCNGAVDDESNNACGGPCATQLGHQPGEPCTNGLTGACLLTGKYVCQGSGATVCDAPSVTGTDELCDDEIDNDCDGTVDEASARNARTWFQDCDGDGYAASSVASVLACKVPAGTTTCTNWTTRPPETGSTDCDDSSAAYHPGAAFSFRPSGKTSYDLDCDGMIEREAVLRSANASFPIPASRICSQSGDCDNCMREVVLNYPIICTTGQGGSELGNGEYNWVVHLTRGSDGQCYSNQEYHAYLYCR